MLWLMLLVGFMTPAGAAHVDQTTIHPDRPLVALAANPVVRAPEALQLQKESRPLAAIALPPSSLTQTATYPLALNQLSRLNAGPPWTWDANGNLTSTAARNYAWAGDNHPMSVTSQLVGPGAGATSFTYDGLGRRTSITQAPTGGTATTTNDVWCGQTLCQAQTSAGAVARAYFAEGEYLPASATSYYDAPDNIGSVRRVFATSAGAASSPTYDYDPYGNALQTSFSPLTNFTYAGMLYESLSGLYLTNHRPCDAPIGRFISRDPLGENTGPEGNLYPYAANDPVNNIDPLGLACGIGHNSEGAQPEEDATLPSETEDTPDEEGAVRAPVGPGSGKAIAALAAALACVLVGTEESWGNPRTLADHFARHGGDFGATDESDYARQASQFLQQSQTRSLSTKIDANGTIRTYDPYSNTFGPYNANGTTKTFYKPDPASHPFPINLDYWNAQRGSPPTVLGGP